MKRDDVNPSKVTLVIGADVSEAFIQRDIKKGGDGQTLLIKTPFGRAIFGNNRNAELDVQSKVAVNTAMTEDAELNENLKKFWGYGSKMELTGSKAGLSQNDMEFLKKLDESSILFDGKYQVPMLWSPGNIRLPNNYNMVLKRFNFLKKSLQKDTKLHQKYKEAMTGYLKNGYTRKLPNKEVDKVSRRTWDFPHHSVFNENKPNKMRIFCDVGGEYDGISLNKALLTSPDLFSNLVGVLLRFRNISFLLI